MGLGNLFGGGSVAKLQVEVAANTEALKKGMSDANKQVKDAARGFNQLGSLASVGLLAAGVQAGKMAVELSVASARVERLSTSFQQLATVAGSSGSAILASLNKASGGTIDNMSLMLSANRAMMLGLGADAEKLGQLMEVARFRGRAMGLTTAQAFSDIVTGVGRMSPLILDNLGIVIDSEAAFGRYAESLGKTAGALSEAEKKQALLNEVLETGQKQINDAGGIADDAVDSIERLNTAWTNLKNTIGDSGWLKDSANALASMVNVLAGSGDAASPAAKKQALEEQINYRQMLLANPNAAAFEGKTTQEIIDEMALLEYQLALLNANMSMGGLATGAYGAGWNGMVQPTTPRAPYTPGKGNRGIDEGWGAGGYIGPTVGPGAYIKNFGDELKDATTATKNYTNTISSGLSTIKGLMSPTSVTRLDELETKHGVYENKWDEPMRRVQDVIQRGADSPWAKQYFGDVQGEQLEMKALQFQRDWGMGLYNQLPLSDDDRSMMQTGLGKAWWQKESGEAQQTALAGDVYKEYGDGIGSAFGTVWDDTVKELAIGKPVIEKLIADIEADSAILNTAGGKMWTQLITGISASDVNALELLINHMAPGMAQWLRTNGYLPGLN